MTFQTAGSANPECQIQADHGQVSEKGDGVDVGDKYGDGDDNSDGDGPDQIQEDH